MMIGVSTQFLYGHSLPIDYNTDVILPDITNVFQIWQTLAGYEELARGFQPIKNREIF